MSKSSCHRTGGRIISFSKEHTDLSIYHYDVSHISPEQRPLEGLRNAQFVQCVLRHCLYPNASQPMLDASDDSDYTSSDDDASISDAGYWEELHMARLTVHDYGELESGSGKTAFENYLKLALSEEKAHQEGTVLILRCAKAYLIIHSAHRYKDPHRLPIQSPIRRAGVNDAGIGSSC
jgi:hypothetical protein